MLLLTLSHGTSILHAARRSARIGGITLIVVLLIWAASGAGALREHHGDGSPAQQPPFNLTAVAGNASHCVVTPADDVFAFLSTQGKSMGLEWLSSVVTEAGDLASSLSPRSEAWQAQLSLSGNYPAIKRWMREATARYPQLVWTGGRWLRPAGATTSPTMPMALDNGRLEVQLQFSWLRQAPGFQGPAAGR